MLTCTRRFASPIFTILVGEDKYMFMAHESVLSQSPVLSRFCKGNFKEAATMEITLPTESRECIGRLLEYLYTGDYACCSAEKAFDEAAELAGMYIAADKYNLPELKRITMKKLASLESFPVDGIDLFSLARLVYSHIPDSDKHFRAYFASYAPVQLMQMEEPDLNQLEEMMKSGGIFAQDCFRAQKLACERKMQVAKRAAEDAPLPPPPPPPKKPARAPSCTLHLSSRSGDADVLTVDLRF